MMQFNSIELAENWKITEVKFNSQPTGHPEDLLIRLNPLFGAGFKTCISNHSPIR